MSASGSKRKEPESSTPPPLSPIALSRIQADLTDMLRSPPEGCSTPELVGDDLRSWIVTLAGPGAYQGSYYRLRITFTSDYPMESPEFVFLDPPLHPHIYSNGHICLDILYNNSSTCNGGQWSCALSPSSVCVSLISMLASCDKPERPPGDMEYVKRNRGKSPKTTNWHFDDDKV